MSLNICPIATVHASSERVWALLAEPLSYARWWAATTDSIQPAGPAHPGQLIIADARALGRNWKVRIRVDSIMIDRKEINLTTNLPLGITIYNHIVIHRLNGNVSQVSFG